MYIARPTGLHSINASRITSPWNVKDTDAVDVISILRRVEIPRIVSTISTLFLCIYIYICTYIRTQKSRPLRNSFHSFQLSHKTREFLWISSTRDHWMSLSCKGIPFFTANSIDSIANHLQLLINYDTNRRIISIKRSLHRRVLKNI